MKVSFTMLIILMMIDCEVKRKEFPWEIKVGKEKKRGSESCSVLHPMTCIWLACRFNIKERFELVNIRLKSIELQLFNNLYHYYNS